MSRFLDGMMAGLSVAVLVLLCVALTPQERPLEPLPLSEVEEIEPLEDDPPWPVLRPKVIPKPKIRNIRHN